MSACWAVAAALAALALLVVCAGLLLPEASINLAADWPALTLPDLSTYPACTSACLAAALVIRCAVAGCVAGYIPTGSSGVGGPDVSTCPACTPACLVAALVIRWTGAGCTAGPTTAGSSAAGGGLHLCLCL